MNVFLHELKSYRISTLFWIASLIGTSVLFLSLLPPFQHDITASEKIISSLPEVIRIALGIQAATFLTLNGFYAYILIYILLIGAIQAMNLGVSIISKEVSGKTVDFLMAKPITRSGLFLNKISAAITLLLITNIIYIVVSFAAAKYYSITSFDSTVFIMLSLTLFAVQIMFFTIGVSVSMLLPKIRSVIAVSLPIVFGFFVLAMLDEFFGKEAVRFMTPFRYYDTSNIIQTQTYEYNYIAIEVILVIILLVSSYVMYSRKDIQA